MNPIILRRLAFIKYLVKLGIEQSKAASPLNGISVLSFHDSIELFLQLASEYLDSGNERPRFMGYWKLISNGLGGGKKLGYEEAMRRLNKARVALKHHGTFPATSDVEAFRFTTISFFEESTPLIFGIEYSEISLSDFVEPEISKQYLKEGEKLLSDGQPKEAINKIAIAFLYLMKYQEDQMLNEYGTQIYFPRRQYIGDSWWLGLDQVLHRPLAADHEFIRRFSDFVDGVKHSVEAMEEIVKILALGIDYRKYSKFKHLTPDLYFYQDEVKIRDVSKVESTSPEDVQYCIDFIIDTAVKLSEYG
jgi:hypothetical protein